MDLFGFVQFLAYIRITSFISGDDTLYTHWQGHVTMTTALDLNTLHDMHTIVIIIAAVRSF